MVLSVWCVSFDGKSIVSVLFLGCIDIDVDLILDLIWEVLLIRNVDYSVALITFLFGASFQGIAT